MILNNAPVNEAVMSNVGEIGEFRIRNSAKAFGILSSGLYANKIRAIIRELSCNAVDSHIAAGRRDTPFDVHLPTTLEPTFSIRDYGTGLSHEQVSNIYTTYFESTKTESNDFIGALGLGSKSPFSYTDNFTVTAIKDGRKGVYTAFINAAGVPSIALMAEEPTTDPAGVEIKFAVENRWDFGKFIDEAQHVYTYFGLRPVVSGPDFEFRTVEYETQDLIPGVHVYKNSRGSSKAIMGNIAYPIDVPNSEQSLGELSKLLNCGLEIHFGIGDVDFQASREGLSYVPQTIDSIRAKLEAVNAQLAVHVATEATAIPNLWDRAEWLLKKGNTDLWNAAVIKYVQDTKFPLMDTSRGRWLSTHTFRHSVDMIARQFNVQLNGFVKTPGKVTQSQKKPSTPTRHAPSKWDIAVTDRVFFVVSDLKRGALERSKYHWGQLTGRGHDDHVFVLSQVDKSKPMKTREFFASLRYPPQDRIMLASSLKEKDKSQSASTAAGEKVTIMRMERRGYGGYNKEREMVWKDAGKASQFDATKTYYYLPLSGYNVIAQANAPIPNIQRFYNNVTDSGIAGLQGILVYGVRKTDLDWVQAQSNWINLQDHVRQVLTQMDKEIVTKLAIKSVDAGRIYRYNNDIAKQLTGVNSVYLKFVQQLKDIEQCEVHRQCFERLCCDYATPVDIDTAAKSFVDQFTAVRNRYPLLGSLKDYDINADAVAQYINLIDREVN